MSTAQVVFSIALGSITVCVLLFALYVASSTIWGNRWVRQQPPTSGGSGR